MPGNSGSDPRKHHYVPACWLAGFTETGEKDGALWVTDFKRRKQWQSSPVNSGHRHDFYRLSEDQDDPLLVETNLSKIEDIIAPVLKLLDTERRLPRKDELSALLQFIAIQWARVPAFGPTMINIANQIHRDTLANLLRNRESWSSWLKENDFEDGPGSEYDDWKELLKAGYSLEVNNDWLLKKAFESTQTTIPCLQARHWGCSISPRGRFIGSDNPVMLDGGAHQQIGFKNADLVVYPVSRHVLLYGTKVTVPTPYLNLRFIARQNTFAMLCADEQVFSHIPIFHWLDQYDQYQTDWRLFNKESFENYTATF